MRQATLHFCDIVAGLIGIGKVAKELLHDSLSSWPISILYIEEFRHEIY